MIALICAVNVCFFWDGKACKCDSISLKVNCTVMFALLPSCSAGRFGQNDNKYEFLRKYVQLPFGYPV